MIFKFTWKSERKRTDKEILKNAVGAGLSLPETNTHIEVIIVKTIGY